MRNPFKKSASRSASFISTILLAVFAVSPVLALADTVPVPPPGITPAAGLTATNQTYYQGEGAGDAGSSANADNWTWRSHQSSQIQNEINALPTTATQSVLMPVLFGVGVKDISPNFGDPRPNGRTHEGEDIMADLDTPIVSPTPAVVLRVETGVSEGNAVYTANPGGETFVYMHLDHFGEGVTVGEVLQTGSLIGYVGNTGDAAGGPTHLHLEIHNPAGTPTDPFPRLTSEVPLAQKISDLTTILGVTANPTTLSDTLVTNFRSTFTDAIAENIPLPPQITTALATVPITATPASSSGIPTGDMTIGSSGSLVVTLQEYLIASATGPAATRLSQAGATGNFGSMTEAALAEFQTKVGITPADGYYGPATKSYIDSHSIATVAVATAQTPTVSGFIPGTTSTITSTQIPSASGAITLSRSLALGMTGDDVKALQQSLNDRGYTIATTGAGSPGNETSYFGPATMAAVIKFQAAQNITPAAGYVGPITRAALAK